MDLYFILNSFSLFSQFINGILHTGCILIQYLLSSGKEKKKIYLYVLNGVGRFDYAFVLSMCYILHRVNAKHQTLWVEFCFSYLCFCVCVWLECFYTLTTTKDEHLRISELELSLGIKVCLQWVGERIISYLVVLCYTYMISLSPLNCLNPTTEIF